MIRLRSIKKLNIGRQVVVVDLAGLYYWASTEEEAGGERMGCEIVFFPNWQWELSIRWCYIVK